MPSSNLLSIGLIGCGYIGKTIATAIDDGGIENSKLVALFDIDNSRATFLSNALKSRPRVSTDFGDMLADERIGLIVEASSPVAVESYIPKALESGKNVMIMSIGALANEGLRERIFSLAQTKGKKVYLPSGAIAGIDCVKAAKVAGLRRVVLTTRKPPKALVGAPGTSGIDLEKLANPTTIYHGFAREAVKLFPANVNVAASLSLAGVGFDQTEVNIIADPNIKTNSHEIVAEGAFGRLSALVENEPSPDNPKTSRLASLSAIRKLIEINDAIQLGT